MKTSLDRALERTSWGTPMLSSFLIKNLSSHRQLEFLYRGEKRNKCFTTLHDMDVYVYELIALERKNITQLCAYNVDEKEVRTPIKDGPAIERWRILAPEIMLD